MGALEGGLLVRGWPLPRDPSGGSISAWAPPHSSAMLPPTLASLTKLFPCHRVSPETTGSWGGTRVCLTPCCGMLGTRQGQREGKERGHRWVGCRRFGWVVGAVGSERDGRVPAVPRVVVTVGEEGRLALRHGVGVLWSTPRMFGLQDGVGLA